MSEIKESGPVIEITEEELKRLCGEFFDVGYYSGMYQGNTIDKSLDIYSIAEKNILSRFYFKKTQAILELANKINI